MLPMTPTRQTMRGITRTGARRKHDVPTELSVPEELQRRLLPWVDVAEVGTDGLWAWLGTVLPLLPRPTGAPADAEPPEVPPARMRELARDLVDCAREQSRLHVTAEQYFRENQLLARRLRALEAALSTRERSGLAGPVEGDAAADRAAERYLPRRGAG